ncbi:MAG: hypothetical protein LBE47_00395 [Methanomassiliicoccaceae archaeon]|jgi:predicted RNA-binding Zn-ribbon protein involved in translation (DUF1610 family)|nr:hypothetical protein [Methanomassiliicoccaceae archaeon]
MEETAKGTDMIMCPVCNASMRFSIADNALKCEHCGQLEEIKGGDNNVMRRELTDSVMREHEPWTDCIVLRCGLCNASIDVDKKDIVKTCPFCGNPNIMKTEELPGIKPDSMIPYKVTKESAVELFKKWIKGKIFAPGECRKKARAENMNSVFSPTWSFSANTSSSYSGTLGKNHTVTYRDSQGRTQTKTEIRWFRVSGRINADYNDVFIPSGKLIPDNVAKKLEPYPVKEAVKYTQEYLPGKTAEHYSRDINTCFNDFGKYVYSDLCQRIRRKYNADHVGKMDINTTYNSKYFNYLLIPNHIANFTYNKKLYNFYVNGSTGKVVGKYPISVLKVVITIAAVVGAAVGIYLLI